MNTQEFLTQSGTITLCGSTRFYDACVAANRLLTLQGWTVLSCGQFGHSYHKEVVSEATGLHTGVFELQVETPLIYPNLDKFLLSQEWANFTQSNPDYY